MQATPWQDKDELKETMFDSEGFDMSIRLKYLDIPSLHTFDEEGCHFMDILARQDGKNLHLFN
jgi:hypothetical protein